MLLKYIERTKNLLLLILEQFDNTDFTLNLVASIIIVNCCCYKILARFFFTF